MASSHIVVQATPSTTVKIATDYDSTSQIHTNRTIVENLGNIEANLNILIADTATIKTNQTTQSTKLDEIKTNQTTQSNKLEDIKTNQATTNSKLEDIKTNQTTQSTKLEDIKTNQTTQSAKLEDIKTNQAAQTSVLNQIRDRTRPAFIVTNDNFIDNRAVVKTTQGVVYSLFCENTSTSARYFQIHNKTTNPADGDTPIKSILVPPQSAVALGLNEFGAGGIVCSNGIAWAWSSTRIILTLVTGTEKTCWVGYL